MPSVTVLPDLRTKDSLSLENITVVYAPMPGGGYSSSGSSPLPRKCKGANERGCYPYSKPSIVSSNNSMYVCMYECMS